MKIPKCPKHGEWVPDGTLFGCPECVAEALLLREVLTETYTLEGVEVWLAAHKNEPYEEQLRKARGLTGMIAT